MCIPENLSCNISIQYSKKQTFPKPTLFWTNVLTRETSPYHHESSSSCTNCWVTMCIPENLSGRVSIHTKHFSIHCRLSVPYLVSVSRTRLPWDDRVVVVDVFDSDAFDFLPIAVLGLLFFRADPALLRVICPWRLGRLGVMEHVVASRRHCEHGVGADIVSCSRLCSGKHFLSLQEFSGKHFFSLREFSGKHVLSLQECPVSNSPIIYVFFFLLCWNCKSMIIFHVTFWNIIVTFPFLLAVKISTEKSWRALVRSLQIQSNHRQKFSLHTGNILNYIEHNCHK